MVRNEILMYRSCRRNLPSIDKPHNTQASCLPAGTVADVAPLNRTISSSVSEAEYQSGEVPNIAADRSRASLAFGRSIQYRSIAVFDEPVACVPDLSTHRILARGDEGDWGRSSLAPLQYSPCLPSFAPDAGFVFGSEFEQEAQHQQLRLAR